MTERSRANDPHLEFYTQGDGKSVDHSGESDPHGGHGIGSNNSDGHGMTLAWRYDFDTNWQIGAEQHINKNSADIRATLGEHIQVDQKQSLAVLQFRW